MDEGDAALGVVHGMIDPVVVVSPDAALIWSNRAAEERFGWTAAEVGGSVMEALHPDDLRTAVLSFGAVQQPRAVGSPISVRLRDRAGDYAWFEVRGRRLPDDAPLRGVVLSCREITDRGKWELAGGEHRALGSILDALPTIAVVVTADGRIRSSNRALTRLLGWRLDQVMGRPLVDLVVDADRGALGRALHAAPGAPAPVQAEVELCAGDGKVPVSMTILDLLNDVDVRGLLVTATDIRSLVAARSELERLATHDDLTDLPNRVALHDHLDQRLLDGDVELTVLFGDVDDLKAVNDAHGHRAGDAFLREIAARLRAASGATAFVARISGDEFVVVLPTTHPDAIDGVRASIEGALEAPVVLPSGRRVRASLSIGVAAAVAGVDASELLASADAAMYVAKQAGALAPRR